MQFFQQPVSQNYIKRTRKTVISATYSTGSVADQSLIITMEQCGPLIQQLVGSVACQLRFIVTSAPCWLQGSSFVSYTFKNTVLMSQQARQENGWYVSDPVFYSLVKTNPSIKRFQSNLRKIWHCIVYIFYALMHSGMNHRSSTVCFLCTDTMLGHLLQST